FQTKVVVPIGRNPITVAVTDVYGESNTQQRTLVRPFTVQGFLPPGVPLVPAEQGIPSAPGASYKAGSTIPLRVQHYSCGQLVSTQVEVRFAPRIALVQKIGNNAPATIVDPGTTASPDGLLFRFVGGTWLNNLSTRGWSSGTYLLTVQFADGKLYRAVFALK